MKYHLERAGLMDTASREVISHKARLALNALGSSVSINPMLAEY